LIRTKHPGDARIHMLRLLTLALALTAAFAVLACGGGDDDAEQTPTAGSRTAVSTPDDEDETPTAEEDSIEIDQAFWHSGWKVTLGEATYAASESGPSVTIGATFENVGETNDTFDSELVLIAGGENYSWSQFDSDFPEVPGGLTGRGTMVFEVGPDFSFDDAALRVGNVNNNQAYVPIGPDAEGELESLEPIEVAVTGQATAGAVTLNVERAELRADFPDTHRPVEKGKLALTIYFSATVGSGIPIGEGVLQSPNVALKLHDGTAVAVISDGRSGVNELLQGKEGTTIPDLSVRFEVPGTYAGEYAFVVRGVYAPDRHQVEGELPFEIVAVGPASTPAAGGTATPAGE